MNNYLRLFSFYTMAGILFLGITATHTSSQESGISWAGAWQFGPTSSVDADTARDVAFMGSGGAVRILDISDPLSPELITDDIRTMGNVEDIYYSSSDNNLYLACGRGGLEI